MHKGNGLTFVNCGSHSCDQIEEDEMDTTCSLSVSRKVMQLVIDGEARRKETARRKKTGVSR
jgi:hypothetical protein